MPTLTKKDIVEAVRKGTDLQTNAFKSVEILLEIIKRTLAEGEDVMVSGFGKFCVKQKKDRWGRNPATSEKMILDARRVVTFKCSGSLKVKLNPVPSVQKNRWPGPTGLKEKKARVEAGPIKIK